MAHKRKYSKARWGKSRCKRGDFYKPAAGEYGAFTGLGSRIYDKRKGDPRNGSVRT